MTYPDRQPIRDDRRLWIVLAVLFLLVYIPLAVQAKNSQGPCISAYHVTVEGATTFTPTECF